MTASPTPRLLVVLGDSMTYWGQDCILGLEHPATFPFRMASHLEELTGEPWRAVNLAHAGRTAFDAHKMLRRDEEAQRIVASADAVMFEASTKDGLLSAFPWMLRRVIGRLPRAQRKRFYRFAEPKLARLTDRKSQFVPTRLFQRCWFGSIAIIRELNPSAMLLCASPTREYGPQTIQIFPDDWDGPGGFVALVRRLAVRAEVPCLHLGDLTDEWFGMHPPEPDFLHWPEGTHDFAGRRAAELLLEAYTGRRAPLEVPR